MKPQNLLLLFAAAGAAYLLLKKQDGSAAATGRKTTATEPAVAPVVPMVEETLHKHEGEDNPIVHAFEEALAQKAGHEDAPA